MIKTLRNTYLTDRFFYYQGLVVLLFVLSYPWEWLFPIAISCMVGGVAASLLEGGILFIRRRHIVATRNTQKVLSLSDNTTVYLKFNNTSPLPLTVNVLDELPVELQQRDFRIEFAIKPNEEIVKTYEIRPTTRGAYSFGKINIYISTPIGLIFKKEAVDAEEVIPVYPSIIQMKQLEMLSYNTFYYRKGNTLTKKIGQSYEFDQIKTYVMGDDTRHINWKASGRKNELMINRYRDEKSQHIYSIIDKGRVMRTPFDRLSLVDYAVNASLALSNIIIKNQDNAGLMTFSEKMDSIIKSNNGAKQLKKIMQALYNERYHFTESNYELLYAYLRRNLTNRSLIFLYTNFDTLYGLQRVLPILRKINRLHLVVLIFFEDTEVNAFLKEDTKQLTDLYEKTIARKFDYEKNQILLELKKYGIKAIRCAPNDLSVNVINKYLQLKGQGVI